MRQPKKWDEHGTAANCGGCQKQDPKWRLVLRFMPVGESSDRTFYFCGEDCWPHDELGVIARAIRTSKPGAS